MDFLIITFIAAYVICAIFGIVFFYWYVSDTDDFAYRNRYWLWFFAFVLWPIAYPILANCAYKRSKEEYDSYIV